MKIALISITCVMVFAASAYAQVSPVPAVEAEIRDTNSIRMRSLELERIKRDAYNPRPNETSKEAEIRFAEIKEDFEGIQKLQASIIKAYTTGVRINFEKIRDASSEMSKKEARLGVNLFGTKTEDGSQNKERNLSRKTVRTLIIELDRKLNEFIGSSLFTHRAVVDTAESAHAEASLRGLIKLSTALSLEAAKQAKASN